MSPEELTEHYPLRPGFYWDTEDGRPGIREKNDRGYDWWHYYLTPPHKPPIQAKAQPPRQSASTTQKVDSVEQGVALIYAWHLLGEY